MDTNFVPYHISDFFPDPKYRRKGWNPQLAYAEALYLFRELRDVAIEKLKDKTLSKQRYKTLTWKRNHFDKMARRCFKILKERYGRGFSDWLPKYPFGYEFPPGSKPHKGNKLVRKLHVYYYKNI